MQGVLRKLSSDPQAATVTVQTLAQILDPSLTEKDLGAFLAKLAEPRQGRRLQDGAAARPAATARSASRPPTASSRTSSAARSRAPTRTPPSAVGIKNATRRQGRHRDSARVALVNGGYTFVDGGTAGAAQAASQVDYADAADKAEGRRGRQDPGPAGRARSRRAGRRERGRVRRPRPGLQDRADRSVAAPRTTAGLGRVTA